MAVDMKFLLVAQIALLTTLVVTAGGATNATTNATIRIAWLAPLKFYYYFNASSSVGSLSYALDTIEADPTLLPGYRFEVRYADSDCNSKSGIGAIFDIMTSRYNPHLILGPACTPAMNPVGQLAALHNIPVFGWISSDPVLADKTKFTTLVRLLGSLTSNGEGLLVLLKSYRWKKMALVSTVGPDYTQLAKGIREATKRHLADGYHISRWQQDIPEGTSYAGEILDKHQAGGQNCDSAYLVVASVHSEGPAKLGTYLLLSTLSKRRHYNALTEQAGYKSVIILCVPLAEVRVWMLASYDVDMADGDYVFIYMNQMILTDEVLANFGSPEFYSADDGRNEQARIAYGNMLMMFQKTLDKNKTLEFRDKFVAASQRSKWVDMVGVTPVTPDRYSLFLYDALLLYAKLATKLGTIDNGTAIFDAASDTITEGGATGTILMSAYADRYSEYWIMDMNAAGVFHIAGITDSVLNGSSIIRSVTTVHPFLWGDGTYGWENRPPDIPVCGFDNENCKDHTLLYVATPVGIVVFLTAIAAFFLYRSWIRNKELNNMYWKINYEDLKLFGDKKCAGSQSFVSLRRSKVDTSSVTESIRGQLFIKVANYRGLPVAVKDVRKTKVKIDTVFLEEFRQMAQVKHNNLLTFIGACLDEPHICIVWEYCSKGSLQDVIWNDNISLDNMFKFSISLDIAKGLQHLHGSGLKAHCRLKSNNVVIDGRWVCKLADFGLKELLSGQDKEPHCSSHLAYSRLMWTPPEVLRRLSEKEKEKTAEMRGEDCSQQGDIYAFGIILKEVFSRNGPYTEHEHLSPQEIIERVRDYDGSGKPFRPDLSLGSGPPALQNLIMLCWKEDPKDRPNVAALMKQLTSINPFKRANVMDNMISMMEKYSNHLEDIVADRTMALEEEKKKTENLLYRMLPKSIAEDLKHGKPIQAESFESVTIYFSDIVRFTDLAAASTPMQVVHLLNALYTLFDATIDNHDVYKVETIGDAYMVVSGLPMRNGKRHVAEIVNCSLDLLSGIDKFKVPHKPDYKTIIRIGVHTGSCVSGVVGLTMPRYCLFGDTVNTASRMESNGLPLRIQLSPSASKALSEFSGYQLADRGGIEVKGKGRMETSWVIGHEEYENSLPDFADLSKHDSPLPTLLPPTSGPYQWKLKPSSTAAKPQVDSAILAKSNQAAE